MPVDESQQRASVIADDGALIVRASAAGRCRRELWYSYHATDQTPPTNKTRTMWEAGWALEPVVIASMERDGWEVQKPEFTESILRIVAARVALRDGNEVDLMFTCHPDAYVKYKGQWIIADVKTRNEGAFNYQMTMGCERTHPGDVFQIAIYTLAAFGEWRPALLAPFNMNDRWWDVDPVPADRIEAAYRAGIERLRPFIEQLYDDDAVPPDRDYEASSFQCRGCAFRATCRPGGAAVDLDLEFEPPDRSEAAVALGEYERAEAVLASFKDEMEPWEHRKKAASAALLAYMEARVEGGLPKSDHFPSSVDGVDSRKVQLQGGSKTNVDLKALNEAVPPDVRAGIVSKQPTKRYVRVY